MKDCESKTMPRTHIKVRRRRIQTDIRSDKKAKSTTETEEK